MKKQLFGLMTILTMLNACQKNEVSVSLPEEATIHATIEDKDATRTVMDESNNVLWSENDQIIAFMKSSYGHKYQVKSSFVGKSYADFSMVSSGNGNDLSAGNEWEHNVVYYPYSENIECLKSGSNYVLEVNLPSEQVYVPDSFANGSMAMVAVSESNNITFKNVLGGIKLQLKGTQTVKSIKIEGKNSEKLSGDAVVTAYTDGNKPVIVMESSASSSVTLTCGAGVQLNESTASEFIISLPPLLFSKGFTVTVTDNNNKNYIVETDKANTILRSSLLVMPVVKCGSSIEGDENDDIYIPIKSISINNRPSKILTGLKKQLTIQITPRDATNQQVDWSSDRPDILRVSQDGEVSGVSAGLATITATADGVSCSVQISVVPVGIATADYIDEYGINHGKGIELGEYVWAPVNCGYLKESDGSKGFPYGKLYQWGRKYGQGLGGDYDSGVVELMEAPVSVVGGQSKAKQNTFFYSLSSWYDCSHSEADTFWNSGTLESPQKTEYDPCPQGWRVPTATELISLAENYSQIISIDNYDGRYFSGAYEYSDNTPNIFLPRVAWRDTDGKIAKNSVYGAYYACYWASTPYPGFSNSSQGLFYYDNGVSAGQLGITSQITRSHGYFIRCVQE